MKFGSDVHGAQMMNENQLGDVLIFNSLIILYILGFS